MNDRVDQVFEMSKGSMRKLMRPRLWLLGIGLPVLCFAATVGLAARSSPGLVSLSQSTSQAPPVRPGGRQPGLTPEQAAASTVSQKFEVASIKPCPGIVPAGVSGRTAAPDGAQITPG